MPHDIKTRDIDKTSVKALERRSVNAEGIRDAIGEISIRTSEGFMRSFSAGDSGDQIENEAVSGVANEADQSFRAFKNKVLSGRKSEQGHQNGVRRDYAYSDEKRSQNSGKNSKQRDIKMRSSYKENSDYVRVRGTGLQSDELMREAAQKDAVQRTVSTVTSTVSNRMTSTGTEMIAAAATFGKNIKKYGFIAFWIFAVLYVVVFIVMISDMFSVPVMWLQRISSEEIRREISVLEDDYNNRLEEYKNRGEVQFEGSLTDWYKIVAVYLARIYQLEGDTGIANAMTEEHRMILQDVFWQMNYIEEKEETVEIPPAKEGDPPGSKKVLHVITKNRTPGEMADLYEFDDACLQAMNSILSPDMMQAWNQLLLGYGHGSGAIIEVARSQVGVREIPNNQVMYNDWYYSRTVNGEYPWCAAFVSWCADQCGLIESGNMIKSASCSTIIKWLRQNNQWSGGHTIVPESGMLIFIDWTCDGDADHIGIVDYVEGDRVHTVEGNANDMVRECSYSLSDSRIFGYGSIQYD